MTVDQSMSPGSAGDARGRRTDMAPLRSEWQAVHGELSTVVEAILAQIFATASRQAVEVLARLEREGTDLLGDLESRRSAAQAEMTELAGRLEHLERRVSMAEEERRQALDAAERATSELLVRARQQADEIVDHAEARATARLAESQEEAARRIADAEVQAAQILEDAQRRAQEIERETERTGPEPVAVVEAAVVEDQLRGLAERISRLLQTTSDVTSTEATTAPAGYATAPPEPGSLAETPAAWSAAPAAPAAPEAASGSAPFVVPLLGTPDVDRLNDDAAPLPPLIPTPAPLSAQPYTFEPRPAETMSATPEARDEVPDDVVEEQRPERDVVVPFWPRTADAPVVSDIGGIDEAPVERDLTGRDALGEDEPDPWRTPAAVIDDELDRRPAALPYAQVDDGLEELAAERERRSDAVSPRPNGVAEPPRPLETVAASDPTPVTAREAEGEQAPVQTLVFQAVPNFQAALALERALKGLPGVSDVRVADFDERQLTFLVTHDLGAGLTRNVLALRSHELDLVDSGRDRAEFVFRA